MSKTIKSIRDCTTQVKNANKHTQRGLGLLEDSIQKDGWIGAITVAADGETFDGSARLEVGASAGFEDAIIVESDGTKPVIVRRTDIATADDEKARRLGVAANRIAQIDLAWDTDVLTQLAADGMDLSDLFTGDEFSALANMNGEGAGLPDVPDDDGYREQYGVIVICDGEAEQERVFNELQAKGYSCKVVVT